MTKTDLADPSEFLAHFDGLDLEVFTSAQDEMPLERDRRGPDRALAPCSSATPASASRRS